MSTDSNYRLIGHQKQAKTILDLIKSNRLAQSIIITGPISVGKKLFAFEMARAINCKEIRKSDSPQENKNHSNSSFAECHCSSCQHFHYYTRGESEEYAKKRLEELSNIKSTEKVNNSDYETATNYWSRFDGLESTHPYTKLYRDFQQNIENVRAINTDSRDSVPSGYKKVIIIEDIHKMKKEQASTLLKTIEEPNRDCHFIFTSSHTKRVLPTIMSRCLEVPLSNLSRSEVESIYINSGLIEPSSIPSLKDVTLSSVSFNRLLNDLSELETESLSDLDFITEALQKPETREELQDNIEEVIVKLLSILKKSDNSLCIDFIDYLIAVRRRLDNNVNLDTAKFDIISKIDFYKESLTTN